MKEKAYNAMRQIEKMGFYIHLSFASDNSRVWSVFKTCRFSGLIDRRGVYNDKELIELAQSLVP